MSNRNKVLGCVPKLDKFRSLKLEKLRSGVIKKHMSIEIANYSEIGLKIDSLLEVLKRAVINETMVEKISPHCIEDVLEVIQGLVPYDEMYLLDTLHEQAIKREFETENQEPIIKPAS